MFANIRRAIRAAFYGPESITSAASARLFSAGVETQAGLTVDTETALGYSAVLAAVRCISETVAMLPLHLYRRSIEAGKKHIEHAVDHPLYALLHDAPNPEQTSYEFREAFVASLIVYGNAYAEIVRDRFGNIKSLWPIWSRNVRMERVNGSVVYWISINGIETALSAEQVFHVRGFTWHGLVGQSLLDMARETVGTAISADRFAARFFANGARPGGMIEHPRRMSEAAARSLRESFESLHKGLGNSHRVAILEEGAKFTPVGVDPDAAQLLEARQYSITDIARIFRLPPHKIGDLSRATFSNIEHQAIEFSEAMQPWFKRIEQRINIQLLTPAERKSYFAEFQVKGLLRTDIKTQGEFYRIMRDIGAFSANDIRDLENMNPLPDDQGDIYLVPSNYMPASALIGAASKSDLAQEMNTDTRMGALVLEARAEKKKSIGAECCEKNIAGA